MKSIELNALQLAIIQGQVCPYCKNKSKYIDSKEIYGKSYGMIYICHPCDAYVGVHKGTNIALGRLANKELREWKKTAHAHFDLLWKENIIPRKLAYSLLSEHLSIPFKYTHIGMFSVETCRKTVKWAIMIYQKHKELGADFYPELLKHYAL
jgi:hypothetical protein